MNVLMLTTKNIKKEAIENEHTVLIDFWAPWCRPCKLLSPVLDEIQGEVPALKVTRVNIDEQPELAQAFGVMSIPTLVVLKGGKVKATSVGIKPKEAILEMLQA